MSTTTAEPAAPSTSGRRRRPVILAVDGEPAVLAAVARDLRRGFGERFQVLRAGSGEEGLEVLRDARTRELQVALLSRRPAHAPAVARSAAAQKISVRAAQGV